MARTKQTQPDNPSLTIKSVTKSSVWDIQENDVYRMFDAATKDAEVKENVNHYVNIFKSAFLFEELPDDSAATKKSYEKRGYKVASIKFDEGRHYLWAIKKRPIVRVTDLTYENIYHPERFRYFHHYSSQGSSSQEGRYVREESGRWL